jgi:hypothetical protein
VTFDDVERIIKTLPGVVLGKRWNNATWLINERGFAWQRPLSKTDIERFDGAPVPQGELLAVMVESLDAKDALLSMELPGFFTIQHFNNFPAVIIELRKARAKDVKMAIADAYRVTAAKPPKKAPKKKKKSSSSSRPRGTARSSARARAK